jgi:hypothetical protein
MVAKALLLPTEARAMDGLSVNRQLMPQRQVFQAQGRPGPEEGSVANFRVETM